jgi:hypothetical protein
MERNGQVGRSRQCFRIWVEGRLEPRFAEGLDDVEQNDVEEGTTLSGAFIDQSQLHGILDHLRALGIDVWRFEIER